MKTQWNRKQWIRFGLVSVCTLVVALFLLSWGKKTRAAEGHTPVHLTSDWSNRHMVYSTPSSIGQALKMQAEPRYIHQWMRRNMQPSQAQAAQ
jgi:hypothetical protein